MASIYYDRAYSARKADRTCKDHRRAVEQEFGEEMRDPRFPPGWYILPLFGVAVLIAAVVYFLS
jgi:hypothetical protein